MPGCVRNLSVYLEPEKKFHLRCQCSECWDSSSVGHYLKLYREQHLEMFAPFYFIQKLHLHTTIYFYTLPLFNDEGLPVFNSASGIPTVFWPSFAFIVCFLFLPRLFIWWAVRARATLPSAVANNTFFKLGVSFSWENIDCRQGGKRYRDLLISHWATVREL